MRSRLERLPKKQNPCCRVKLGTVRTTRGPLSFSKRLAEAALRSGGPGGSNPLLLLETSRPRIAASSAGAEDGSRFTQTPHLEFSDESGTAVRSIQNRIIRDDVEKVVNAWRKCSRSLCVFPRRLKDAVAQTRSAQSPDRQSSSSSQPSSGCGSRRRSVFLRSPTQVSRWRRRPQPRCSATSSPSSRTTRSAR